MGINEELLDLDKQLDCFELLGCSANNRAYGKYGNVKYNLGNISGLK